MDKMPADIALRRARADDMSALARLYALLSTDQIPDPQRAAFAEVEADGRQTVFLAEIDGRIAGTATVIIVPNLRTPARPYAIVENVVVEESARRSGVGAALIQATINAARAAGCYKVALTSRLDRAEAHAFYERLGFVTTQRSFRLDLPVYD